MPLVIVFRTIKLFSQRVSTFSSFFCWILSRQLTRVYKFKCARSVGVFRRQARKYSCRGLYQVSSLICAFYCKHEKTGAMVATALPASIAADELLITMTTMLLLMQWIPETFRPQNCSIAAPNVPILAISTYRTE